MKTTIVCSIGPASWSEEGIKNLAAAGMTIARLNFSHDDHASHLKTVLKLKTVAPQIPLMLDTKGPELWSIMA